MTIYQLSDDAEHDLNEIYRRGFWKYGERQADKFYNQLFERLELLVSFPESGRGCDFIYLGLRRIEVNPYTVFYMTRPYGIYVVRLLRQSQIANTSHLKRAIESPSLT